MSLVIHWFRQDLRLADNPALTEAARAGQVLPVYILDDEAAGDWAMGGASRWWLHRSLEALNDSLGRRLRVMRGGADRLLPKLAKEVGADAVYWNRCYEPWRIERDSRIKQRLQESEIEVHSHAGSLLWEPWQVLKADGAPYRVFTPFYRKGCLQQPAPRKPLAVPDVTWVAKEDEPEPIDSLGLLPDHPWHESFAAHWQIGEAAALRRLDEFLHNGLVGYKKGRDCPARENVSRLSPALHFGELSPNQVWYAAAEAAVAKNCERDLESFHSELGWREFSYYLLYHFPQLPEQNFQSQFDGFSWRKDDSQLRCWQRGQTGVPLIDAGMRELWQTGYMHNRVRMVVASFLVKNLRLHWREGERWFWDCLVDADLASNSASWQWVAGSGADAAPYFRIFNPVLQGEKFDPGGAYVRRWVPELAGLPDKWLHKPWEAPADVLLQAGVEPGKSYPRPIVDLAASRKAALDAYSRLRKSD